MVKEKPEVIDVEDCWGFYVECVPSYLRELYKYPRYETIALIHILCHSAGRASWAESVDGLDKEDWVEGEDSLVAEGAWKFGVCVCLVPHHRPGCGRRLCCHWNLAIRAGAVQYL